MDINDGMRRYFDANGNPTPIADEEVERLSKRVFQLEAIIEFGAHSTLEQYWSLMRRAADALETLKDYVIPPMGCAVSPAIRLLIDELRKAAK